MPSFFRKNSTQTQGKTKTPPTTGADSGGEKKAKGSASSVQSSSGSSTGGNQQRPSLSKRSSRQSRRASENTHPLNLPPEEIRRLSAIEAEKMSAEASGGRAEEEQAGVMSDPMETTPAPEDVPGAFPTINGVNGAGEEAEGEEGPVPPPHRMQTTSPAPVEEVVEKVDAEACKAAGNKFYKAGQYGKAIEEYTKGEKG